MTTQVYNSLLTPQSIVTGTCKLTSSNAGGYDVPTNAVQLLAAQPNGARITRVQATPGATTVAGDVELYAYNGSNYRHIKTVAIAAQTITPGSNTAAVNPYDFGYSDSNPILLSSTESLFMALSVAQTAIEGRCEGGAY
ncbi:MAG TPA: hypothetical protein VJP88_04530 [Caulobacteraceae bacterium]|nr:hypothetical protein [Caulobacteraceae bacterium]